MAQVGNTQTGLNTLGLVVEDSNFSVAKATEEIRVSLVFTVQATQSQILQAFAVLTTIAKEWQASACFEGTSPLKDQLYQALEPGSKMLDTLKSKYLRFFTYLQEKTIESASKCILESKMFNEFTLTEEPKQLVSMRTGIILTGTAASIWEKKEIVRAAAEFSMVYNSFIANLGSELDETLSNLNLLSELIFPQNLRGSLETLSCLVTTGADFEKIEVLRCNKGSAKFICEITVSEPATITVYTKLRPVVYEDVRIRIPAHSILVKDVSTTKFDVLECDDEQAKLPICKISDKFANCKSALEQHDTEASIQACRFEYSDDPFAIRLGNEAILIQGQYLSILDGTATVVQRPPLLIYSNNVVKVSTLQEEISFKPTITVANPRIETSKVSQVQVAMIKLRAYWTKTWDYLLSSDLMSYASLGLELIFAPLTLVGLILSCKKRVSSKRMQKKNRKRSRKDNYQNNMELLSTRSSRGSRR